jgi:hypothetical protein
MLRAVSKSDLICVKSPTNERGRLMAQRRD